jgi:membrane-associated phospholipid phosphatase
MKSRFCLFFLPGLLFFQTVVAQNTDIDIVKSLNEKQTAFKTNFCKIDAQSVTVFNIGAPVGVFAVGLIKHNKELQKDALYMAGAFVVSSVVTNVTKQAVKRKRPFEEYPFITKLGEGGGYSFPSGHTSAAFTTATSLSLYFPKWYVIIPSYLWASSVAYARVYQGVHYPSDVLAGALVGAGSAWLGWKVQKWMNKKHMAKNK